VIALEHRGGAGLAQEPLARFGVGRVVRQHHLQRDPTAQLDVVAEIDGAHPALAEFLEHAVAAELADLAGVLRRVEFRLPHLLGERGQDDLARAREGVVELSGRLGFCAVGRARGFGHEQFPAAPTVTIESWERVYLTDGAPATVPP
jgi:hypothetical protein